MTPWRAATVIVAGLLGCSVDRDGDGWPKHEDCDDSDAAVHPQAEEGEGLGDGVDQDCDGVPDDGTLSFDDDGDGFSEVEHDCDDTDPDAAPGLDEVPQSGRDENCDGSDAGPVVLLGTAAIRYQAEEEGQSAGFEVAWMRTGGTEAVERLLVGADGWFYAGGAAPEPLVYLAPVESEGGSVRLADAVATMSAHGGYDASARYFGSGDLDDDGFTDVAMGAPFDPGSDADGEELHDPGRVWIWKGPLQGSLEVDQAWGILGLDFGLIGYGVGIGDVDADGVDDLLVGCAEFKFDNSLPGRVRVFLGPLEEGVTVVDTDVALVAEAANSTLGAEMTMMGDANGDGYSDIAIGAPELGQGSMYEVGHGGVYVLSGPLEVGEHPVGDGASTWLGPPGSNAGISIAATGDVTGDGRADLLVGGHMGTDASGPHAGHAWLLTDIDEGRFELDDAAIQFSAEGPEEWFGVEVSSAGDFDGDGLLDVAIAAPGDYYTTDRTPGKVYIFRGPFDGPRNGNDADLVVLGEEYGDGAGNGLAGGVDVNGDGYGDLAIGAPLADTAGEQSGAAYIVLGREL